MRYLIFNGFFAVLFLLFAAVQYNDPDPALWMLVYGSMAVIAILANFDIRPRGVMIAMMGGMLFLSALHVDGMLEWLKSPQRNNIFDNVAKMEYPYIEEAREFLGLLICMLVLLFYFYQPKRKRAAP